MQGCDIGEFNIWPELIIFMLQTSGNSEQNFTHINPYHSPSIHFILSGSNTDMAKHYP
jgi:hypothetical protein